MTLYEKKTDPTPTCRFLRTTKNLL